MKSGPVYFLIVFAAGFALGTLRVLVLVPRVGERMAEFIELPVMIAVSFFTASFIVRKFEVRTAGAAILTGGIALTLLVLVEFTLVLGLRGLSFTEYIHSRDPYSFAAYLVSLGVYAVAPLLVVSSRQ